MKEKLSRTGLPPDRPQVQWPQGGLSRMEFTELVREALKSIILELKGTSGAPTEATGRGVSISVGDISVGGDCILVINSPGALITINH